MNNVVGSVNLINASVNHDVKCFVFTSSIAVYGAGQVPMSETMRPEPEDSYGIAKYAVERELAVSHKMFGLPYVIFRPHNVYGELQNIGDRYRNVLGIFVNQIMQDKPLSIFGDGEQTRAFSYVGDIIPAIASAPTIEAAQQEVFNVGADVPYSVNHLADTIRSAMGVPDHPVVYHPPRHEVVHAFSDHAKLRSVFGDAPSIELRRGRAAHGGLGQPSRAEEELHGSATSRSSAGCLPLGVKPDPGASPQSLTASRRAAKRVLGKGIRLASGLADRLWRLRNRRRKRLLVYTDSRGYDVAGKHGRHAFETYVGKLRTQYHVTHRISPEQYTTLVDFLAYLDTVDAEGSTRSSSIVVSSTSRRGLQQHLACPRLQGISNAGSRSCSMLMPRITDGPLIANTPESRRSTSTRPSTSQRRSCRSCGEFLTLSGSIPTISSPAGTETTYAAGPRTSIASYRPSMTTWRRASRTWLI